jgi:signal peptidase
MVTSIDAAPSNGRVVPRNRFRRVSGIVGGAVTGVVVFALLALAASITLVPAIAGGHALTVLSGSMEPALPVGSIAVDRPASAKSLRVGDIVTYTPSGEADISGAVITHRIVAIHQAGGEPMFTVKGDNNRFEDRNPVASSQIRGKLWYDVPYLGTARNAVLNKATPLIIGALLLLGTGIWVLRRTFCAGTADDGPGDAP